uniref:SprB repeat-containing protein n=1 Tax=uncultured Draconibacterium sp. TaxID=1573823 RepID=UPI003217A83B
MRNNYAKCRRWCSYLLLFIGALLYSFTGNAQITIDGDPEDWGNVFINQTMMATFVIDEKQPDGTDSQFTEGTKDFDDAPQMIWSYSQVSDKNEITNVGVIVEIDASGDEIMYFMGDREATNGSAEIGFWVFQDGTAPREAPYWDFYPPKVPRTSTQSGDLLILFTFTQGGRVDNLEVYEFLGTSFTGVDRFDLIATQSTADIDAYVSNPGKGNFYPVPDITGSPYYGGGDVWNYYNKNIKDWDKYIDGSFVEGYVNLTDLELEVDLCGANFLMETRVSHSLTSMTNDFAFGAIGTTPEPPVAENDTVCGPEGSVELCATGVAGDTIKWYGDAALTEPPLLTEVLTEGDVKSCYPPLFITEEDTLWVTATSEFGCCSPSSFVIGALWPELTCNIEGFSNVTFHGGANGSINLEISGGTAPFTILWTSVAEGGYPAGQIPTGMEDEEDLSGLTEGIYRVHITDVNGCETDCDQLIEQPQSATCNVIGHDALCFDESTGSADVSWSEFTTLGHVPVDIYVDYVDATSVPDNATPIDATGMTPPYYSILGLPAGTYMIRVQAIIESILVYTECPVTIEQPPLLEVLCTGDALDCFGDEDGVVSVAP